MVIYITGAAIAVDQPECVGLKAFSSKAEAVSHLTKDLRKNCNIEEYADALNMLSAFLEHEETCFEYTSGYDAMRDGGDVERMCTLFIKELAL